MKKSVQERDQVKCGFKRSGYVCGAILVGGTYCSKKKGDCPHQLKTEEVTK